MKVISSEDRLPRGWFLTRGPRYGVGFNNGSLRWLLSWHHRRRYFYFVTERVPKPEELE